MENLIKEIQSRIPLDLSESQLCSGLCQGCPKKLIEFLDQLLSDWCRRLDSGEIPSLGDVERLAKTATKIYKALQKNQLV